jgi:hypothetical protein
MTSPRGPLLTGAEAIPGNDGRGEISGIGTFHSFF